MASALRVDPSALRQAGHAQAEVATYLSGMAVGDSMAGAGQGVSGLLSAAACRLVGELLDTASAAAHEELAAHAEKLSTAADRYQQTDEEHGERLRRFAR